MTSVTATVDLRPSQRLGALAFLDALGRHGARHVRRETFAATALTPAEVEPLGDTIVLDRDADGFDLVLALDADTLAHLQVWRGRATLTVAAGDRDALDPVVDDLVRCLRDPRAADDRVPVTFISRGPGGMTSTSRRELAAPGWTALQGNYAPATATALDRLMAAEGPGAGGLLLWHGPPGTGKSYAVRALAGAWRTWCDVHVVTEPEVFFSTSTDHLVGGLLRREDEERWRLFVVEDAGEFLAADAHAVAGQAVSRLLNLTDGLLGAGLRSLVLVTTNEPLRRIHPAIARPGRCWAQVHFAPLPVEQANAWLVSRRSRARVQQPTPLADLYALARGQEVCEAPPVGFAASSH